MSDTRNDDRKRVMHLLDEARDLAEWNMRLDKRLGEVDNADRWSATLGLIENAQKRLAS